MRRGAEPSDLSFTAGVSFAALLPRLYAAIAWAREPVWDGHYYDYGARRIAAGLGYSDDVVIDGRVLFHPWCHYPVGYSGFLGILYRLFGDGSRVAPVANAVVGALLVGLVHRLMRYATTPQRARVAAALTAASPGLIVYAALLMTEPLAAFGLVLTPWLFVRFMRRDKPFIAALGAGAALGLTTLVRPQSLLVAPALALLVPSLEGGAKGFWSIVWDKGKWAGAALVVSLAVVAPWTIRNCRVMDGCAFVSTNAGWNLAIGASPRATGRFETIRATDGCPVVTGQVQQDRCWRDEGLKWIRRDPLRWLGLIPKKLAFTFDHESFPMGYLGEADPLGWPEPKKALGRELLSFTHRLLLFLAALGLVARPTSDELTRRGRDAQTLLLAIALTLGVGALLFDEPSAWPLAVFVPLAAAAPLPGRPANGGVVGYLAAAIATVALTHAVFFGEDRYHMVVTPALCMLSACALRDPWE